MTEENGPHRKKKYESPKITEISLRPEEAVLGNCKVAGVSGPGQLGTCANLGGCTPLGS
jgi:hypothetical protein